MKDGEKQLVTNTGTIVTAKDTCLSIDATIEKLKAEAEAQGLRFPEWFWNGRMCEKKRDSEKE